MTIRPELDPLPARLTRLVIDDRGYPVPWFVPWIDGQPEFRAMDGEKLVRAVKERRCWVCGDFLGVHLAFPIGPMCALNRNISEPPSHYECAHWSVMNCPFLTRPHMVRREDDLINPEEFEKHAAGVAILRNPGVMALWITRTYTVHRDANNKALFEIGEPERVEWYTQRRRATRAEIEASIDSGLPLLEAAADRESNARRRGAALDEIRRRRLEVAILLPAN